MKSTISNFADNFLRYHFIMFKAECELETQSRESDLRGLAMAWIAMNFGHSISTKLICEIEDYLYEKWNDEKYATFYWWKLPGLFTASFFLTKQQHFLNPVVSGTAAAQSWARQSFLISTAMALNLIPTNDIRLMKAAQQNCEYWHGDSVFSVIFVLLNMKFDKNSIQTWAESLNSKGRKDLFKIYQRFINMNWYSSSFFLSELNAIKSFVLDSIFSGELENNKNHNQLTLEFDAPSILDAESDMIIFRDHIDVSNAIPVLESFYERIKNV